MTTTIAVENYRVHGAHGVFEHEWKAPQPFVVSLWVRLRNPPSEEDLTSSVDYGFLQRCIHDVIACGPTLQMMETICAHILEPVTGHLNVAAARIRIEKPEAPMPHDGGLAVVERTWPEGQPF